MNKTPLEHAAANAYIFGRFCDGPLPDYVYDAERIHLAAWLGRSNWHDLDPYTQDYLQAHYDNGKLDYPEPDCSTGCECGDDDAPYFLPNGKRGEEFLCGTCYGSYLHGWYDMADELGLLEEVDDPEIYPIFGEVN